MPHHGSAPAGDGGEGEAGHRAAPVSDAVLVPPDDSVGEPCALAGKNAP